MVTFCQSSSSNSPFLGDELYRLSALCANLHKDSWGTRHCFQKDCWFTLPRLNLRATCLLCSYGDIDLGQVP